MRGEGNGEWAFAIGGRRSLMTRLRWWGEGEFGAAVAGSAWAVGVKPDRPSTGRLARGGDGGDGS